jgi:hypothetical protein
VERRARRMRRYSFREKFMRRRAVCGNVVEKCSAARLREDYCSRRRRRAPARKSVTPTPPRR